MGWAVRGSYPDGGRDFSHTCRPTIGRTTQNPAQRVQALFPGGKAAGTWSWSPLSRAEVKESVELYLYSPFVSSWPLLVTFTFTFVFVMKQPHITYYDCEMKVDSILFLF